MDITDLRHGTFTEVRGRLNGAHAALGTLVYIMDKPTPAVDSTAMLRGNIRLIQESLTEATRLLEQSEEIHDRSPA